MNDTWQAFLQQNADLEHAPLLPDCALADLSYLGLIRASGKDARDFLQGQLTNDIRQLSAEHSQLSSYCSPKGRMLAAFRLFEREGAIYLQLPRDVLPAILKRLRMFVMRAEVTLDDASDELVCVGLAGDCAPDLLPGPAPADDNATVQAGEFTLIRIPGDRPRFELIAPSEAMQAFWSKAAATATPASPDCWPLLDIRAGLPTVFSETAESFVPQMANLQLIDGVSFTKGCYTGQEIVARMQYLGKLKRRMYRVRIDADQRPQPGEELFSASSASGQGAGRVVDARPSPTGGYEALVVTQISSAEQNDLHLGEAGGPPVVIEALPYAFAVEGE